MQRRPMARPHSCSPCRTPGMSSLCLFAYPHVSRFQLPAWTFASPSLPPARRSKRTGGQCQPCRTLFPAARHRIAAPFWTKSSAIDTIARARLSHKRFAPPGRRQQYSGLGVAFPQHGAYLADIGGDHRRTRLQRLHKR